MLRLTTRRKVESMAHHEFHVVEVLGLWAAHEHKAGRDGREALVLRQELGQVEREVITDNRWPCVCRTVL